jgi:hypothetical protein
MTMANPPAAARALLGLILTAEARDTVSGDLIEEYREARIPRLGRWRADLWYWRQVAGLWLRSYWWFVALTVVELVVHDVFNAFRAPSGASYLDGVSAFALAPLSPLAGVGLFALVAAFGSWRTHTWTGGFVAAVGTCLVVWLFMAVWWNVTLYPFAQVQQSNPYWIQAWHWSTHRANPPALFGFNPDSPDESFVRWLFWDNVGGLVFLGLTLLAVSVVCGGVGGALGLIAARWRRVAIRRS